MDMSKNWNEDFGESLRVRRRYYDLTLEELAQELRGYEVKASASSVYRWEVGDKRPSADAVEALAELLECKPTDFRRVPSLR